MVSFTDWVLEGLLEKVALQQPCNRKQSNGEAYAI